MPPESPRPRPVRPDAPSQTLSRALTMLEDVAEAATPPTIAELAEGLGVHRSVAYRMLRTFEEHGLLRRDDAGRVLAAPGLAVLAGRVEPDLRAAAQPELAAVSGDLHMTAFLVVWDGVDCLTLASVEPPRGNLVTQRPGTRHPLGVGAPGIAIAAAMPQEEWAAQRARRTGEGQGSGPQDDGAERPEVAGARERGWASSRDEVLTGVSSVAVPLAVRGQFPAALAVVFANRSEDLEAIGARLSASARRVAAALGDG